MRRLRVAQALLRSCDGRAQQQGLGATGRISECGGRTRVQCYLWKLEHPAVLFTKNHGYRFMGRHIVAAKNTVPVYKDRATQRETRYTAHDASSGGRVTVSTL